MQVKKEKKMKKKVGNAKRFKRENVILGYGGERGVFVNVYIHAVPQFINLS